eukprot:3809886-Amphidinium_carterae.1
MSMLFPSTISCATWFDTLVQRRWEAQDAACGTSLPPCPSKTPNAIRPGGNSAITWRSCASGAWGVSQQRGKQWNVLDRNGSHCTRWKGPPQGVHSVPGRPCASHCEGHLHQHAL